MSHWRERFIDGRAPNPGAGIIRASVEQTGRQALGEPKLDMVRLTSGCSAYDCTTEIRFNKSALPPMSDTVSPRRTHHAQSYRADVDGLRALAVIAVMFCHAGFAAFRGGFVGVDVFFTISGFVVTNSIVDDLNRNAFSFKEFYARRGKRLIPALYAMLAATFVFSLLFCVPEDTFRLGKISLLSRP